MVCMMHEFVMSYSRMSHVPHNSTSMSYCRCPQARLISVLKNICGSTEEVPCQTSQYVGHDPKVKKQKVISVCSVLQSVAVWIPKEVLAA